MKKHTVAITPLRNRRSFKLKPAVHYFPRGRRMDPGRGRGLPALLFLVVTCTPLLAHGRNSTRANANLNAVGGVSYLNTARGVAYTGSKACSRCHLEIYRSYTQTLMGRSMALLPGDRSRSTLSAGPITIHLKALDRYYQVFRSGPNLYQSEYALAPDGATIFRDTRRISYVVGAGENGISYITQQGNYLFEAPLSYYAQSRSWNLAPGYEFGDYGFHRLVPVACIGCHSGRPRPVAGRPGLYQDPPFEELAVGCENCHGPGQLHVEERAKGNILRGSIDRSIVNPADVPGWLADNVCMVCHQGGDTRILEPGKTYLDFRPGMPLDGTVAIFAVPFTPQSPPQDPLLQQYTQMVLSACYRASGEQMTCLTCHDPHLEPTSAEAPSYYRKRCLACHTQQSCKLPLAERMRKSPPNDCVACHMPRQTLQKISHSALTNHRIIAYAGEPFPNVAFHMTTPVLPDLVHVDAVPGSKAPPRIVLLQAYGELMAAHPEYKPRYNELLDELAPDQSHNPLLLSALGRRAILRGTADGLAEGQNDIGQAIAAGSTVASDFELYANLLVSSGKAAEAIGVLKEGIYLNPYSTRLYKRLALAYIQVHDYSHALQTMKQELTVFPEDSLMRMLVTKAEASRAAPGP
jgi:hypothetical protein